MGNRIFEITVKHIHHGIVRTIILVPLAIWCNRYGFYVKYYEDDEHIYEPIIVFTFLIFWKY